MRRRFLVVAGLLVLLAGAASAYYVTRHRFGGDVVGSTSGFHSTQTVPLPRPHRHGPKLLSPMFGGVPEHLHVGVGHVRPPYRLDWVAGAFSLIEFPPAVAFEHLYYATFSGKLVSVATATGTRPWTLDVGRCEAAGPAASAYRGGTVYETFLNRRGGSCNGNPASGLVIAVAAQPKPRVRWRRNLGASETSPTVVGRRLYMGTANGYVYCLNAENGRTIWHYYVGAPVKGAVAYDRGKVFFGAYDGYLHALSAATGKSIWATPSARDFEGGHGNFYSTPAVAYSRVYLGSTDGKVYAFDERTGHLAWSHATGAYVYGSPAVYRGRVFIGSYDHNFYALNAATGNPDWTFPSPGRISGTASVIGGLVYFSSVNPSGAGGRTYALSTRTGRKVWSWPNGAYASAVTDGSKLYLVGWGKIYAFSPRRHRRR